MNDPAQRSAEIKLDSIIAEYLRLTDAGQQVDVESFLAAHQEVAEEFREFLGGIQVIDQHGPRGIALPTKDTLSAQVSGDTEVLLGRSKDELAGTSPLDPDDRDFGRYILQRKLGEGAMGTVFLAEDTALNRMVALKQPRFAPNDDRSIKERFFREARAVAMLDHPNVCPVYDIGEHDGIPYLTMTFIEGRTLKQMLDETPQISERQATTLIRGIANGLAQAHERGIMHRDLKPGNIMISQRNEPVVMDFGLARQFNRTTETPLTEERMLVGTPAYMSPEQLACDQNRVGPQSDIYSLGIVFYEMLTGQVPYPGVFVHMIAQIMRDAPERPSNLRHGISSEIENVCLKMMSRSQDDRFQSMEEVVDALTSALEPPIKQAQPFAFPETTISTPPQLTDSVNGKQATQWQSRLKLPILGAVAVCLCVVLSTAFFAATGRKVSDAGNDPEITNERPAGNASSDLADEIASKNTSAATSILFDGTPESLANFRGYHNPDIGDRWSIEGDALKLSGNGTSKGSGQDLITKDAYRNFELTFDWKISSGGNSGVFFRIVKGLRAPNVSGIEYQLIDDQNHPDANIGKSRSTGAIYALYAPRKRLAEPWGSWNTSKIRVNDNRVEYWLNGEQVVEAIIGSADWKHHLRTSKLKRAPHYAKNETGHICFQDYGTDVWFRNIEIKNIGN